MTTINLTQLSKSIAAYNQCNQEWKDKAEYRINELCKALPHGSGIDDKCEIDLVKSSENKIVFNFEYHHMSDGYYSGWTSHSVIITPNFGSFNMKITGQNKNDIKEYLNELWSEVFSINETITF